MNYNLKHYAYIGDCVWELFIREYVITKTKMQALMHKMSTKFVCATFQASAIEAILNELNEDELIIQKRARNLKMTINKKSNPKVHSLATSFEALIGYLYLNNKERLNEILNKLKPLIEESE